MDCQIEGIKHLNSKVDEATLCARLNSQLADVGVTIADIRVAISPRGAITAHWTNANGTKQEVGVDVMDRPLSVTDLDQLATLVAQTTQK